MSIKYAIFPTILFLALLMAVDRAYTAPVHINCEKDKCETFYAVANMGTKKFVGRCVPKRTIDIHARPKTSETTVPNSQQCRSGGSKNVTCTVTVYNGCFDDAFAMCDCTNWALKRNTVKAEVRCVGPRLQPSGG